MIDPRILPVSVIAAICLFLFREVLEYLKKKSDTKQKLKAFRHLLSRECELNYFAFDRMKQILTSISSACEENGQSRLSIARKSNGQAVFVNRVDEKSYSMPVPTAHSQQIRALLTDLAILNQALFEKVEMALDATTTFEHLRDSLIHFLTTDDEYDKNFLCSFPGYALRELKTGTEAIFALYTACTGKTLDVKRVR